MHPLLGRCLGGARRTDAIHSLTLERTIHHKTPLTFGVGLYSAPAAHCSLLTELGLLGSPCTACNRAHSMLRVQRLHGLRNMLSVDKTRLTIHCAGSATVSSAYDSQRPKSTVHADSDHSARQHCDAIASEVDARCGLHVRTRLNLLVSSSHRLIDTPCTAGDEACSGSGSGSGEASDHGPCLTATGACHRLR